MHLLTKNVTGMQSNMVQFQEETRTSIKNLERQIGQVSSAVTRLEAKVDLGKLPSQTELNPRVNVSCMTLIGNHSHMGHDWPKSQGEVCEVELVMPVSDEHSAPIALPTLQTSKRKESPIPTPLPEPPFPEALKKVNDKEGNSDIYETFRKCHLNIPLLDAINHIPRYAKFLKEICTAKRKPKVVKLKKVKVLELISSIFHKKLPPKCNDPGMFTVPCVLDDVSFPKAMLDLGASINVISDIVFESLNLGKLQPSEVVIQLANHSTTKPKGVVKDVLVKVGKITFPADFYVLDMGQAEGTIPILLGRPFLKTARAKIDVHTGLLTLESAGESVAYSIYDSVEVKSDVSSNDLKRSASHDPGGFYGG